MYIKLVDGDLVFYVKQETWENKKAVFVSNAASDLIQRYDLADFVVDTAKNMLVSNPLSGEKTKVESVFDKAFRPREIKLGSS